MSETFIGSLPFGGAVAEAAPSAACRVRVARIGTARHQGGRRLGAELRAQGRIDDRERERIIGYPERAFCLGSLGQGPRRQRRQRARSRQAHDLHAFAFVKSSGGLSIAIDKDEVFDRADEQLPAQRVDNLPRPD
jgi:hypothetical protein